MKLRLKKCIQQKRAVFIVTGISLLFIWIMMQLDKYIPMKENLESLVPNKMLELISEKFQDKEVIRLRDKRYGATCSESAFQMGFHQKVVSYSFYKNPSVDGYWTGMNETVQVISKLYPGWQVRIYANSEDIQFLQTKISSYSHVFFCDVSHLPPPLITLEPYPATIWRFASMGDPQVDTVIFRDTDSQVTTRELDAVNEWLNKTKKTLHIMRDNIYHMVPILAGMWGLRITDENRMKIRDMREKMYSKMYNYVRHEVDQPILKSVVWETLKDDFIAHDSYHCTTFKGSSPWPSKRSRNLHFVGSA